MLSMLRLELGQSRNKSAPHIPGNRTWLVQQHLNRGTAIRRDDVEIDHGFAITLETAVCTCTPLF